MLKLYKVPGSFIFCFVGPFGVGKSLGMLEQAALTAEVYDIQIVSNFYINSENFDIYCRYKKYKRVNSTRLHFVQELYEFFDYHGAVFLLDEASIYLFSRNFKATNLSELRDLFQLRKFKSFLYFTCQNVNQIDIQLRTNVQTFIVCKGFQMFSRKKQCSILYSRFMIAFSQDTFNIYNDDYDLQTKWIRPLLLSGWRFSTRRLWLAKIIGFLRLFICFIVKNYIKAFKEGFKVYKVSDFIVVPFAFILVWWERHYKSDLKRCLIDEDYLFSCYDSFNVVNR